MKMNRGQPPRPVLMLLAGLTAAALSAPAACGGEAGQVWLPFAPAPAGQWGAYFSGEYDQRKINGDESAVRRLVLRMGGTPCDWATFWVEGGIASLWLSSGGVSLQGDWGTAAGAGASLVWRGFEPWGLAPFADGRATLFISRLGEESDVQPGITSSRRSRFEWRELSGAAGLCRPAASGMVFAAVAAKYLFQEEKRTISGTKGKEYTYESGLKPGIKAGLFFPLKYRFTLWVSGDIYADWQGLTLAVGQWGSP